MTTPDPTDTVDPIRTLADARDRFRPFDEQAAAAARARHDTLVKPPGALGRLETLAAQLSGIAACCPAPVPRRPVVAVFAGDHGVHAEGVTPWPQAVTTQMVHTICTGGAGINALAATVGAQVVAVDVGVATAPDDTVLTEAGVARSLDDLSAGDGATPGSVVFLDRCVARGTANLAHEPAMTAEQAGQAIDVGVQLAVELAARGFDLLVTGDMGIANTTPSAALIAAFTGRPAAAVTGLGTGISPEVHAHKIDVVQQALDRLHATDTRPGPLEVLGALGGFEHAALTGFLLGARAAAVPVIVDGVIATSALVAAAAIDPDLPAWVIAGHRSVEPGASAALEHLGLEPLLDLSLRLGEGTGAILAVPLVVGAAAALADMATLDGAGIAD